MAGRVHPTPAHSRHRGQWGSPSLGTGHIPGAGDGLGTGWDMGLLVGLAGLWGAESGPAAASLGQGLTVPGAGVGCWAVGSPGGPGSDRQGWWCSQGHDSNRPIYRFISMNLKLSENP